MDFSKRKRTSEMWHVDVWHNGAIVLTIGHNHVSGVPITPEVDSAIRKAANSLLCFVGPEKPDSEVAK